MGVVYVIEVVVAFGLLVFVHELGHFLAAKKFGVRVEVFSLGFGPHIGRKWGETEYRLSLVPLGGYVKLAGELREDGREPASDELFGKPVWQRIVVFGAGAAMNVIFGLVAFSLAYGVGVPVMPAIVGEVDPGTPAWHAGLEPDDRIIALNGRRRPIDFIDLTMASALAGRRRNVELEVQRGDKTLAITVSPEFDEDMGIQVIGVKPKTSMAVAGIEFFLDEGEVPSFWHKLRRRPRQGKSPARDAGFEIGDRLLAINGEPVGGISDLYEALTMSGGKPLHFDIERVGAPLQVSASPRPLGRWLIGIMCHSTVVEAVRRRSWADRAGIRPGDRIVAVDKAGVARHGELEAAVGAAGETVAFEIERDGKRLGEPILVASAQVDLDDLFFRQGNIVDTLTPGFGAEKAGIRPGDRIVAISGPAVEGEGVKRVPIRVQMDMTPVIMASGGHALTVEVLRGGEKLEFAVVPHRNWLIGLLFRPVTERRRLPLIAACGEGLRKTGQWVARFYLTLRGFFTGQVASRLVGGPVGILRITYESARHGPGKLFYWMGLISINLALLNILPIPVLDGGHCLFALIEKAKGSPVSAQVQAVATYVGLGLLLSLLVYATWNDIVSLVTS